MADRAIVPFLFAGVSIVAAPLAAAELETVWSWRAIARELPPGMRVHSAAADRSGAIWVLEDAGANGLASVWRLDDRGGSEFARGLVGASALRPDGAGGALVLESPNLVRLVDADGDGRAESSRILARTPDATGIAVGADGWIRLAGTARSVRAAGQSRRSWPFPGEAAQRDDGSWVSVGGSSVTLVVADDHAIARNPAVPAPWGTVVTAIVEGEVSGVVPQGNDLVLVEDGAIVRRSVAIDGTRLVLGEAEPVARRTDGGPLGIAPAGSDSFVVFAPDALWLLRDELAAVEPVASATLPEAVVAALAVGGETDAIAFPIFRAALLAPDAGKAERDAVLAGLGGRELAFLRTLLADPSVDPVALRLFATAAAASVLEADRPADVRGLLAVAADPATPEPVRAALLSRVLAATEPHARRRRTLAPDAEPSGWRDLVAASTVASAADGAIRWPGRADLPPLPDPDADLDPVAFGQRVYATCLTCHGSGGRGQPGIYPPLRGADWVVGDPDRLVKILLHGLTGPIRVNGERYASVMQLPRPLDDREIAAVLTYVRQAWGNDAPPVDEASVRAIRAATAGRTAPWTEAELGGAP